MSDKSKKIQWIKALYWLVIILLFLFVFVWINGFKVHQEQWSATDITIVNNDKVSFIQKETIKEAIKENNFNFEEIAMDTLNRRRLEEVLEENPFVKQAEVYTDFDGKVFIDILQHEPLLRVHKLDTVFYLDKNGDRFPFSSDYSARVPVFQIDLPTFVDADIMKFYNKVEKSKFIKSQLSNVYINQFQEISFVSKFGDFVIELGPNEGIEEKFKRFKTASETILQNEGWNTYSKISLAFKDQVVCTKREM
jgi:cell division protein FtsQ